MTPTDFLIPVTTLLPQRTHARLARVAKKHETTVAELVAELVNRALVIASKPSSGVTPGSPPPSQRKSNLEHLKSEIRRLNADGWNDVEIARHLNEAHGSIYYHRDRMKLPARGKFPTKKADADA